MLTLHNPLYTYTKLSFGQCTILHKTYAHSTYNNHPFGRANQSRINFCAQIFPLFHVLTFSPCEPLNEFIVLKLDLFSLHRQNIHGLPQKEKYVYSISDHGGFFVRKSLHMFSPETQCARMTFCSLSSLKNIA